MLCRYKYHKMSINSYFGIKHILIEIHNHKIAHCFLFHMSVQKTAEFKVLKMLVLETFLILFSTLGLSVIDHNL